MPKNVAINAKTYSMNGFVYSVVAVLEEDNNRY